MTLKKPDIGPLEMEVLGFVRSSGEQSVSQIQEALKLSGHKLAYTTVMTVLVRLYNKGLLSRRKESRHFLYAASEKRDSSAMKIFERVKRSLFRQERLNPILSLLDSDDPLTREELVELKQAVERKLMKKKS